MNKGQRTGLMTFVLITLAITIIHVRVKVWFDVDDDDHDDEILWTHITGNVSLN